MGGADAKDPSRDKRNFLKGDYDSMKKDQNMAWSQLLWDYDISLGRSNFVDKIEEAEDKYIPKTRIKASVKAKSHKFIPLD